MIKETDINKEKQIIESIKNNNYYLKTSAIIMQSPKDFKLIFQTKNEKKSIDCRFLFLLFQNSEFKKELQGKDEKIYDINNLKIDYLDCEKLVKMIEYEKNPDDFNSFSDISRLYHCALNLKFDSLAKYLQSKINNNPLNTLEKLILETENKIYLKDENLSACLYTLSENYKQIIDKNLFNGCSINFMKKFLTYKDHIAPEVELVHIMLKFINYSPEEYKTEFINSLFADIKWEFINYFDFCKLIPIDVYKDHLKDINILIKEEMKINNLSRNVAIKKQEDFNKITEKSLFKVKSDTQFIEMDNNLKVYINSIKESFKAAKFHSNDFIIEDYTNEIKYEIKTCTFVSQYSVSSIGSKIENLGWSGNNSSKISVPQGGTSNKCYISNKLFGKEFTCRIKVLSIDSSKVNTSLRYCFGIMREGKSNNQISYHSDSVLLQSNGLLLDQFSSNISSTYVTSIWKNNDIIGIYRDSKGDIYFNINSGKKEKGFSNILGNFNIVLGFDASCAGELFEMIDCFDKFDI